MENLILTYIPAGEIIGANDAIIDFTDNIANYTGIELICTLTCGTAVIQFYNTTEILDVTGKFYLDTTNKVLRIGPLMFNLLDALFVNGVYRVDMKITDTTGHSIYSNCLFIDIDMSCKVAGLLDAILIEKAKSGENPSTIAHILHYSLVNGSNCGCNCDAMCDNYNALVGLLDAVSAQISNDCGCK